MAHCAPGHPSDVDERLPVLGAGAMLGQRRTMGRSAVALVLGEAVARMFVVHRHHDAVAADFGQYARRRDAGSRPVAADNPI